MFIAYAVVASLFALILLLSGYFKLTRNTRIVEGITSLGVPLGMFPFLAACEIAGALGLLAGIWFAPLGIAAAIGLVLYFVLAVGAHLRRSDFKGVPNALVMLVLAVLALAFRLA
ncbi:MAG: DoxX family protein [Catenulispora sp.]